MKSAQKKPCASEKRGKGAQKCSPVHCTKCIFLSMLHADLSSRGRLYGKIKYAKENGKFCFTYYDENICKMLGYSPDLIGKDAFVILHPADKKIMMQRAKDRMQGKEVENEYLTRLKRKDGTYILVKVVGASPNKSGEHPEAEFIVSTCYPVPKKKALKKS